MRLFLLFASLLLGVNSLKFLVFSSQFARSHANYLARLADVLVEAGHEVVMLAPTLTTSFAPLAKKARVIQITQCEEAKEFDKFLDRISANIWVMRHQMQMFVEKRKINAAWGHACLSVIDHPGLMDSLRAESFDAAFTESPDVCGPVVFHLLGIASWAATESVAIRDGGFELIQTPSNPAYVPSMMAGAGEAMSFYERLSNTAAFVMTDVMIGTVYADIEAVLRPRLPDLPPIRAELLPTASLVFLNSEPLVDFPRPTSARIIDIGGITVARGHAPLNETWSALLDLRPRTVLLSFGSMAKAHSMPEEYKRTIRETIRKLPDVTFIWKYEKPEHGISDGIDNLIEATWVPQVDMLHDPRLSAFITHCGQGSTTEAIDAGVRLIVIPVLADQLRNSHQVVRNGLGRRLDKTDLATEGKLEEAIREVLGNDKYRKRAKQLQKMVAERPFSMREIFVRNMEFLARHGPLRQLDHYGRHLNFFQYYLIDVIAFVLLCLTLVLLLVILLARAAFRRFFASSKVKQE